MDKNLSPEEYQVKFAKTLYELNEESNEYDADVRFVKEGLLVRWDDMASMEFFSKKMKELGFIEEPINTTFAYMDDTAYCECCRRILSLLPQHVYWQPDWMFVEGDYVCSDCINVEELVEERIGTKKCIFKAQVPVEKLNELGWYQIEKIVDGFEYENDIETQYENLVDKYGEIFIYCEESAPLEATTKFMIKK